MVTRVNRKQKKSIDGPHAQSRTIYTYKKSARATIQTNPHFKFSSLSASDKEENLIRNDPDKSELTNPHFLDPILLPESWAMARLVWLRPLVEKRKHGFLMNNQSDIFLNAAPSPAPRQARWTVTVAEYFLDSGLHMYRPRQNCGSAKVLSQTQRDLFPIWMKVRLIFPTLQGGKIFKKTRLMMMSHEHRWQKSCGIITKTIFE